jgi:hypothetical protein
MNAAVELVWPSRVVVSEHALERTIERLGWADPEDAIIREVNDGILHDRVAAVRPNWTRGNYQDGSGGHCMYVWDREATRAWAVIPNRGGTDVLVATLLLDRDDYAAQAEQLRIRRGHTRSPG